MIWFYWCLLAKNIIIEAAGMRVCSFRSEAMVGCPIWVEGSVPKLWELGI